MASRTITAASSHILQPAADLSQPGAPAHPVLTHGAGIHVFDTAGRQLIDGPGGMWCAQIGHGRAEIAQAIAAQAQTLAYTSPWYFTNSPAEALARRIAAHTPGDLNRIFFTTGGSTAVDSALRFAEFYNNVLGRPEKKHILVRHDGYHGSTHLTAACSGRWGITSNFDIASERITHLSSPGVRARDAAAAPARLDALEAEFRGTLARIGPERVAVFLAEPVQASGGMLVPPQGYHARIKRLCDAHDILYISDEVVTAFGRCGHWFASDPVFGVTPDIITFAKGVTSGYVPLGGMAVSERLIARIAGAGAEAAHFWNGYTYSGHPVAAAAAMANMDVIEADGLLAHVRALADPFREALATLADLPFVADTRACGLLGCVELQHDPAAARATERDEHLAARVDAHCADLGLILRPVFNSLVMSPPLIVTRAQIDEIVAILREAICRTAADHDAAA